MALSGKQLNRILEEIEAVNDTDKKETVKEQYTNLCIKCGRPIDFTSELVLPVKRHFSASDYDDIGFIHYDKEDCI